MLACLLAGLAFCTALLGLEAVRQPSAVGAAVLAFGAAIVFGGYAAMRSVGWMGERLFFALILLAWIVSRASIIAAFPAYKLADDELYLHRVVVALANGGLTHANLAALSSLYDYPVWVSRALPTYYPLRVMFGNADLLAVRVANLVFDAGTLLLLGDMVRRLFGSPYGRCALWLYLIFPAHVFDVLAYSPLVPGSLLAAFAVWTMVVSLRGPSWRTALWAGPALGGTLLLAGVQRGGYDLLFFAAFPFIAFLRARRDRPCWKQIVAMWALCFVAWWPAKSAVDAWVASHDIRHLRSHALGFFTRGSNPVTLGEYLLRYEQLDASVPQAEKSRVLISLAATQAARQPLLTLGVVPAAKLAKFFAIGHSQQAENGLRESYPQAHAIFRAMTAAYAPVLIVLALLGTIRALTIPALRARAAPLCLIEIAATAAIVLFWEASPRYSDGLHIVFVALGALGIGALRRGLRPVLSAARGVARPLLATAGIAALCWMFLAGTLYAGSRRATLMADAASLRAELNAQPLKTASLYRRTRSWETGIIVPKHTILPATIHLNWGAQPPPSTASLWLAEPIGAADAQARVAIPLSDGSVPCTLATLGNTMVRIAWRPAAPRTFTILPQDGQSSATLDNPVVLGVGYALP